MAPIRMSYVTHTYGCVMSHVWLGNVAHMKLQVIFRKRDLYLVALLWKMICNLGDPMSLRHPWLGNVAHMKVSHIWRSRGTHMKESWHTYKGVMSRILRSHGTHMKESWHTYKWVMLHIWRSHVTHMTNMSHPRRSHVTNMKESCHTLEWVMSHIWRPWVMLQISSSVFFFDMFFYNVTRMKALSHVACFKNKFDMICIFHISRSHTRTYITGWRRPIGCLKLQVNFRKRATNYRALLRKMTYKDKASYGSSPPCSPLQGFFVGRITYTSLSGALHSVCTTL